MLVALACVQCYAAPSPAGRPPASPATVKTAAHVAGPRRESLPDDELRAQAKRRQAAKHPELIRRLPARLISAWEQATTGDAQQAVKGLSDSGIRTQGDQVMVIAQCEQGAGPAEAAAAIAAQGGTVLRVGEAHVKAFVPVKALDRVSSLPGVLFVRLPIEPKEKNLVLTEGRAATLASAWHTAGYTGQGIKLAVVDSDFLGLSARMASGEIPASAITNDFTGTGMTSGTDGHGCACAEIVYDMAPNVQLYLLKTSDPSDWEAAKNYCKTQGIRIVSKSGGFDTLNFHDGIAYSSIVPHPVTIVNDAVASGILWVNAAGNEQQQHALAAWRDANADRYLEWDSGYYDVNELWNNGDPIPAGAVLDIYLTWNKWPVTDQDFDLRLYRLVGSTWTYITSSEETQSGTQPPRENLTYTVPTAGTYGVAIYKYSATTSPTFILRSYPYDLWYFGYASYTSPAPGSIIIPGDAASAFTVGAIDFLNYTNGPIESFSSLGPNNGAYTANPAVTKPDICGPDAVSTETYGAEAFAGTSAATPHIAALAALVMCMSPSSTVAQTKAYIESNGFNLGIAGKDNTYGSGAARLPAPPLLNHAPTNITLSNSTVAENLAAGAAVGALGTRDPDAGDTFVYALTNGTGGADNGSFNISGSNLLTAASFNYEIKSNYSIRVRSADQGGLFTQKVFAISVADVDETPALGPVKTVGSNTVLRWSSVTNHVYSVYWATNLMTGFSVLQSNIPATPSINSYTDTVITVPGRFWKVSTVP
jgi:hypothetical protein